MKKNNTALIITTSILSVVLVVSAVCAGVFFGKNAETIKSVFSNSGQNFVLSSVAEAEKAEAVENAISETVNVANADKALAVNDAYRAAEEVKNRELASAEQEKNDALNAAEKEKAQIIEDSNKALANAEIEKEQAVSDAYVSGYNAKLPNFFEIETIDDLNSLSITNDNQWTQIFDAPEYEPIVEGVYVECVSLKYSERCSVVSSGIFGLNGFLKYSVDYDYSIKDEELISFINSLIESQKYYKFTYSIGTPNTDIKLVPLMANIPIDDIVANVDNGWGTVYNFTNVSSNAKQIGVLVEDDKMYTYGFNVDNFSDNSYELQGGCWKFDDNVRYVANGDIIGKYISKTFYADCYPIYIDSHVMKGYLSTLALPSDLKYVMDTNPNGRTYKNFVYKINGDVYYNMGLVNYDGLSLSYVNLYGNYTTSSKNAGFLCTSYLMKGEPNSVESSGTFTSYYNDYCNGNYSCSNGMIFLLPNQTIFDYNSGESLSGGFTMLVFFPEEIETFEIVSITQA